MDDFGDIENEIQHLIIRYLEGNADEGELLVLREWLEESDRHFSLFDQFRQDWTNVGGSQRYVTEKAWCQVEQRLSHRIGNKRPAFWLRVAGYAAAVVLMVTIAYYSAESYRIGHQQAAMDENIEPGGKKAILVLSSHEEVVLGDEAGGTLFEGNITVKKEGNTLFYDKGQMDARTEEYNRLITPRGGEYSVVLADGTKVWLNVESELRYPVNFSIAERKVYLKGEAYFSVTKRENQPFVVYSDETQVTVLGTEFNVRNYGEGDMVTTLVKGAVKVTHENAGECRLVPGQQAIVRDNGIEVQEVEPIYYTAWKDGYFIYNDKTLDDILKELSRWYDFTYFYQNRALADQMLTAKLQKFDNVEQIFEILSQTGHFEFVTKGRTVTVKAK